MAWDDSQKKEYHAFVHLRLLSTIKYQTKYKITDKLRLIYPING